MGDLLFELPQRAAARAPHAPALAAKGAVVNYEQYVQRVEQFASVAVSLGVGKLDRIAVYLPKEFETVITMFGATRAGCVFVPINPVLKPAQVVHILRDCGVRALVTSSERASALVLELAACTELQHLILVGSRKIENAPPWIAQHLWDSLLANASAQRFHRVVDADMAAIFYTSGSTGKPKGVVLSHKNMVTGAQSVAQYLANTSEDRLLAVLPFSFDYGFSQLSTAFCVGASVVLMDYLFPRDIIAMLLRERITGLAGVPPLWSQLADCDWPSEVTAHLRYVTNSGGAMPEAILHKLRHSLPRTQVFLMYGLTEAFRSTFLPPSEIDTRPGSIGKAIPNAEVLVVRQDGTLCDPQEPGELVHRGSLVSLGYWNDLEKTAHRFRPSPGQDPGLTLPEIAVWSGDTVRMDEDGYLYFVGRRDEMIKTSGYRVSPTEVEEVVFSSGLVIDAAAVGVPHPALGQAIAVVATAGVRGSGNTAALLDFCRKQLPAFMMPAHIEWRDSLPRNPNGKYDRPKLAAELQALFITGTSS